MTEYVTYKGTRLPLYPWTHPSGRKYWRFSWFDPDRCCQRYGTRSTYEAAKAAAKAQARTIASGMLDIASLSRSETRLLRAFLDLKPSWDDIDHLKALRGGEGVLLVDLIEDFRVHKVSEGGRETTYIKLICADLMRLAEFVGTDATMQSVTSAHISAWLDSLDVGTKRKKDYRSAAVQFWRWAARMDRISVRGVATEAEKTPAPRPKPKTVEVYTPEEMTTLLKNVEPRFLAWLVICAFSGVRAGEVRHARKEPMDWSCVKADHVEVPASLSKNRKRRLAPVLPILRAWLDDIAPPRSGPIAPVPPDKRETKRLGALIGGWKPNALRHSYGTYRVAVLQDVPRVAVEMDNSPQMVRRHYMEAVEKEVGEKYFDLFPGNIRGTG